MEVIDHQENAWFLLQDNESFLIDANCSHSFVDYTYTVRLTSEEVSNYKKKGREYLDWLAHDIHYSAPGVKGSTSKYKKRKVPECMSGKVTQTIVGWRQRNAI